MWNSVLSATSLIIGVAELTLAIVEFRRRRAARPAADATTAGASEQPPSGQQ